MSYIFVILTHDASSIRAFQEFFDVVKEMQADPASLYESSIAQAEFNSEGKVINGTKII